MIKKLCSYPGCHKVVEAGVKYCDKHRETDRKKYREYKQRRMRDEQEARRQQFYNSKAWEQFRAAQAAAQLGIDIYEYYTTGRIIDAENYHHIQEMIEAIVLVFGNQFTFEEADDGLDEISSIILNFSLINAEIMNNTNIQAEETAKTLKTNIITVGGKEYESGKIGRKKYRAFREVYDDLVTQEKQTYTDDDLDRIRPGGFIPDGKKRIQRRKSRKTGG